MVLPRKEPNQNSRRYLVTATYEQLKAAVLEDIGKLPDERQQDVLRRRFGLTEDGKAQTLEEVGQALGLTGEQVRKTEGTALGALRRRKRTFSEQDIVPGSAEDRLLQALFPKRPPSSAP